LKIEENRRIYPQDEMPQTRLKEPYPDRNGLSRELHSMRIFFPSLSERKPLKETNNILTF